MNLKNLKPNELIVKELIENLLSLQVNLAKIKDANKQRLMIIGVIKLLENPKNTITFQDLFKLILFIMQSAKSKETKAISAKIFIMLQKALNDTKSQQK